MTVKLTQQFVDSVKPSKHPAAYHASSQYPGFVLKVYTSGKKVFLLRYRQNGGSRVLVLGDTRELSVKRALTLWEDRRYDIRQGVVLHEPPKKVAKLQDAMSEWFVEHMENIKPNTIKVYRDRLDKVIFPALGKKEITKVLKKDVRNLIRSMSDTPVKANQTLQVLNTFFKWAVDIAEYVEKSPTKGTSFYPTAERSRFLTADESTSLLAALRDYPRQRIADLIRLLMLTGARRSEIKDARWEWVDFEGGSLNLPDSKTGAATRFLSAPALQILHRLGRKAEGPIFDFSVGTLYYHWYQIVEAAGLKDFRIHDLRHNFASVAVSNGMNLEMIGELLGHASLGSTQRYAHMMDDPQKEAVNRIAESFDLGDEAEPQEADVIAFRS